MRIGILGGGLVGLVVAAECRRHDCEVLEMSDAVGGHCQSLVEDGYTFDVGGPHILFSKNKEILSLMLARLGGNIEQRRRNNKIWFDGRFVKYPFENGLYDLAPQDRFECLYHYLTKDYPPPANFKEWIYHAFGKGIAEKYMLPYNEKIWNIGAENMSLDWIEGRVPLPPIEDVVKSAVGVETEGYTHQLFFSYPKTGGIVMLPLAFARQCRNITLDFPVEQVWKEGAVWRVRSGKVVKSYDKLVTTIPIEDLLAALPEVPSKVTAAVRGLRYNSLITVMIGAVSSEPYPYTALYVPDTRLVFHRLSFPLNFTDEGAPAGHQAIEAEITTNPGDGIHEMSDDAVAQRVISDLGAMGLLKPSAVGFLKVHRTKYAYVVRTFDYKEKLAAALDYLRGLGIVSVGRNSEFEYINMDEAVRRGLAVAAKLNGA